MVSSSVSFSNPDKYFPCKLPDDLHKFLRCRSVQLSELCHQPILRFVCTGSTSAGPCVEGKAAKKKKGSEWAGEPFHTDTHCIWRRLTRSLQQLLTLLCLAENSVIGAESQKLLTQLLKVWTPGHVTAASGPRSACWRCLILIQNKEVHFGWGFGVGEGGVQGGISRVRQCARFERSPGLQSWSWWSYLYFQRPHNVALFSHTYFFLFFAP